VSGRIHHPYFEDDTFDWRDALRNWRKQQGLTQAQLAERSGLSLPTIRSYEYGQRLPTHANLLSVIAALGIPREEANPILMGAGYAVDWQGVLHQDYVPFTLGELQAEAEALPWPAFVTNQGFDVLYANQPAQLVVGVDMVRDRPGFGERNILSSITEEDFASRVENWDEVVTVMCGLAKGDREWASGDLAHPAPWLRGPLERLLRGNPARVQRLAALWQSAPATPNRIRHSYKLRWRHAGGVMAFRGRLVLADIFNGIHWNEWVPADSATWEILRETGASGPA